MLRLPLQMDTDIKDLQKQQQNKVFMIFSFPHIIFYDYLPIFFYYLSLYMAFEEEL